MNNRATSSIAARARARAADGASPKLCDSARIHSALLPFVRRRLRPNRTARWSCEFLVSSSPAARGRKQRCGSLFDAAPQLAMLLLFVLLLLPAQKTRARVGGLKKVISAATIGTVDEPQNPETAQQ